MRRSALFAAQRESAIVRSGLAADMRFEALKCAERTLPSRSARYACGNTSLDLILSPTGTIAWVSRGSFEPGCEAFGECIAASAWRVRHTVSMAADERVIARAPPTPLVWWADPALPAGSLVVW